MITKAMALVLQQLFHIDTSPQQALLLLFPLLLLLVHIATTARASKKPNLPPSPPKLPFIGHLHIIGALPHVSLRDLSKKHGPDLMLLRLGTVPNLIVTSPRAAQAIMRTYDHIFASRPRSKVADIVLYGAKDVGFAPYGEHWRQARKVITTHLLTVKKVQSYRLARQEEVRHVIAKIRAMVGVRATVDMSEVLNSFSNDIVCHAVSGKFFREEGRNKMFSELIEMNSSLFGGFNLEDYFPSLGRIDVLTRVVCARAKMVNKRWDELLDKVINDHANGDQSCSSGQEGDFVDVLLALQEEHGLTREHMKAILIDMFVAGTDTSYLVLEMAMAELMRSEQLRNKLQAEVRSIAKGKEMVTEEDVGDMTYLKAVIKETLRLHPPAPLLLPHLSMEDCDVEGYKISSGTRVIINAWALGRDPESWEAAEEFKPERFVGNNAVDFGGKDFQFIPFGAGRRICPGINFAMATIESMLANLMYHFDWELPPGMERTGLDMSEVFGLTVHRKEKLLLVPKSPGHACTRMLD